MIRKIKKQGGSLMIAIPKDCVRALGLEENCEVDISCHGDNLMIRKTSADDAPKGCAEAVAKFKQLNSGGMFDPTYGRLMFDRSDGKVWVDKFYSLGRNDFNVYNSPFVVNLGNIIQSDGCEVTEETVKAYAEKILNHKSK